jgi:hypothetical protein
MTAQNFIMHKGAADLQAVRRGNPSPSLRLTRIRHAERL